MMDWSDVLKVSVPVLLAVTGWMLNESSKRRWERYKRKEERYIALLSSLKGFYVNADPTTAKEDKNTFIQQLSVAWLYCPDTVIRKGYKFLGCVRTGVCTADEEKDRAVGEFVVSMREDLFEKRWRLRKKTNLNASDFLHFRSN